MIQTETVMNKHTGNDVAEVFDYDYMIHDEAHLTVEKITAAGAISTLVLNTDYSVQSVGLATGTITMLIEPLPQDDEIYIVRELTNYQDTNLRYAGSFNPETHEGALDRLEMHIQQLQWRTLPRVYTSAAQPTARLGLAGQIMIVRDTDSGALVYMCLQQADDDYGWGSLGSAPL